MSKKKITHDIVCDECGKPATRNVQESWVEWKLKANGEYSKKPVDIECNGDSYHYCDDCN